MNFTANDRETLLGFLAGQSTTAFAERLRDVGLVCYSSSCCGYVLTDVGKQVCAGLLLDNLRATEGPTTEKAPADIPSRLDFVRDDIVRRLGEQYDEMTDAGRRALFMDYARDIASRFDEGILKCWLENLRRDS